QALLTHLGKPDPGLQTLTGPRDADHDAVPPAIVDHGVPGQQVDQRIPGRGGTPGATRLRTSGRGSPPAHRPGAPSDPGRSPEGSGPALAAGVGDQRGGDLRQETAGDPGRGAPPEGPGPGVGEGEPAPGPGDADVTEPALLLEGRGITE